MCNVPSVTLQTAVLLVIEEFADVGNKFSAHDITRSIRDKCNNGQMEIPEVEDLSGADSFRFNVDHVKVRNIFNEMRDNGVFDADYTIQRKFNGMFFEYNAQSVNSSVTPPPTSILPVLNIAISATNVDRITTYLSNCAAKKFHPTLRNIQSAIKRDDCIPIPSCEELKDYIKNTLKYSIVDDPSAISRIQVVTT